MSLKEKIQLVGAPQRLAISPDGNRIAYVDMKTSNVYILDLQDEEYPNKLVTRYPNTSKIILGDNVMYLVARTVPKMRIVEFDLMQDNKKTKTKKDKEKVSLSAANILSICRGLRIEGVPPPKNTVAILKPAYCSLQAFISFTSASI